MKYLILLIAAIILLTGYGYAADKPAAVTLNECIYIALQNNTSVKASEEDKNKALAEYRVARAQQYPILNFDLRSQQYPKTIATHPYAAYFEFPYNTYLNQRAQRQQEGSFEISRYYNLGLSFGLVAGITLYDEKKNRMIDSARSGVELSQFQSRKAIYDVIYNVKKNYYLYVMAKDNILLREKLLKSNEDRLKITELLYKNAQKPILDLNRARYEYNEAKLELQKAKNSSRVAKMELFMSMGISDPGVDIVPQEYAALPQIKYAIDELNKLGDLNYPDLQIARQQKKANKIKINVERGGHYPTVELQGGASYENGNLNAATIGRDFVDSGNWRWAGFFGFVARFPIYSGGAVNAKIDSAKAEYNKSVYKEKEAGTVMRATVENCHLSLLELREQIDISLLMLDNAEKQTLLAKKTYQSGAGTQLDLHDANVSLINARIGYAKAKYDYLMTLAKLSSIVGLGEESLCKK
ncbi:MAG: hypothetical protein A2W19_08765 [Spirochaetes bacterium RBG_16_49_21]|nr:MAG: hypothetical protein A2W19_08765 [Spirochaetes bacterium RBG_16_49_21]